MSKITSVLKSLGETGQINGPLCGLPPPNFFTPFSEQTHTSRVGQIPTTSNAILGVPSKNSTGPTHHRRTLDMSLPGNTEQTDPQHAHLLATRWLSAGKLAELVRTEGLVYKKGKFSAIEEHQLKAAMEKYRTGNHLTEEQLQDIIFPKNEKSRNNVFWTELTFAVPQRPIIAVYHHIRRAYHAIQPKGPWTPNEDALLKQAVTDLGQRWEKVSERVGRRSSDCRDRYRNHIQGREKRVTGPWSKAEEEKLTRIVTDMTINQGRDIDNDVFWGKVSELMDGTRGRQQCRIKWTDALSKTVKNEGKKPRWGQQDAFILIHKIDSLNVRDDTEIDWKTLPDPDWNLWSAHTLQRRWLTMKRSIKGFEDMTHQEIIDILRVKKAHLPVINPASQSKKRKERKVTSAEAVSEPTDGNGNHGANTNFVARQGDESSSGDFEDSSSGSSSVSEDD
ncbi:hypothetical protein BDQ17DRAFT_1239040 [Cyathus striatus]|nr:hypothetical protein BDQ17DRAFT_1239040 [Cyathus striatus]